MDFVDHGGIQGRGRFIQKEQVGIHAEGTCNGHALFLTAGQFVRIVVFTAGKADCLQHGPGFCLRLLSPETLERYGADGQIFEDSHIGKQVEGLKDHSDLPAGFPKLFPVVAHKGSGKIHLSAVGNLQTVDASEEGAFSRAGGTDHRDHFTAFNRTVHVLQRGKISVFFCEMLYLQKNLSILHIFSPFQAFFLLWISFHSVSFQRWKAGAGQGGRSENRSGL